MAREQEKVRELELPQNAHNITGGSPSLSVPLTTFLFIAEYLLSLNPENGAQRNGTKTVKNEKTFA